MSLVAWQPTVKSVIDNAKTPNKEKHEFHASFADNFFLSKFDSVYNYKAIDLFKQKDIPFSYYKDAVLLIVNVASF